MNRKAFVAGATGEVGKEIVKLLLNEPAYTSITLIVRRPTGISHPKLQEKVVDFDQLEQTDMDLTGADVFCTLGTTIKKARTKEAFRQVDYVYPLTLGRIAKVQGAKQFLIVTSIGANPSSRLFYTRVKGDIEESLHGLNLPGLHIFRPSLLLGNREEFRTGERIASAVSGMLSPLFAGPLRKYKPIQAHSVAKAMLLAAESNLSGMHVYESNKIAQESEPSRSH
ncbi:oxidoreductase [Niallia sp. FSL W8-1348]|uniref:oxidoreductase n=1 Tax=Niallia sp. FSL W8-1348 TaxID=2954656 RepID=UPI0030FB8D00